MIIEPIVAIIVVVTMTTTAVPTNKFEYESPYCAGKVAKTAAANPLVNTDVIIRRSLVSELFNVVNHTAPYRVIKRIIESTTPDSKMLKLEIETIMPKKTKKKVLIRKAISDSNRFKPLLTDKYIFAFIAIYVLSKYLKDVSFIA